MNAYDHMDDYIKSFVCSGIYSTQEQLYRYFHKWLALNDSGEQLWLMSQDAQNADSYNRFSNSLWQLHWQAFDNGKLYMHFGPKYALTFDQLATAERQINGNSDVIAAIMEAHI